MTSRKDRIWLRLGLAGSKARYGRGSIKRAPTRRWESSLQAEDVTPPSVSEDEEPVEVPESTVEDESLILSGEESEEGLFEDAVGEGAAVEVPEFSVEELSSIPSREEADEGLPEDTVGDEAPVEVPEFFVEELKFLSSREKAEEGSSEDDVGDEVEVDDDRRSSSVKGREEDVGAEQERKGFGKWSIKRVSIFMFFFMASLIGSVSVVGLLQSRESVGSSGIVVHSPLPPVPALPGAPPPEPKIDVDVFSDLECTARLTRVEWGPVEAGGSVDRVVYVRNMGDYGVVLSLMTDEWDPDDAAEHMGVSWDYDGEPLGAGAVAEIMLTLSVSASTPLIGGFSFDIVFVGLAS